MGTVSNHALLAGIKGKVGSVVIKRYKNRIVICAMPDRSSKKPTALQKVKQQKFSDAVQYAKAIVHNPAKKAAYLEKVKEGEQVYHYAIREFLDNYE